MKARTCRSKIIRRGRFSLHLFLNASGYYNLGFHIYHRNNGFKFAIDGLFFTVSLMYVGTRAEPWLKRVALMETDT